jgi:hypothetical protein
MIFCNSIWCGAVGNLIAAGIRFVACGADGHARAGGYIIGMTHELFLYIRPFDNHYFF